MVCNSFSATHLHVICSHFQQAGEVSRVCQKGCAQILKIHTSINGRYFEVGNFVSTVRRTLCSTSGITVPSKNDGLLENDKRLKLRILVVYTCLDATSSTGTQIVTSTKTTKYYLPTSNFFGLMSTPMMRVAPAFLQPIIVARPTAPKPQTAQVDSGSTLTIISYLQP